MNLQDTLRTEAAGLASIADTLDVHDDWDKRDTVYNAIVEDVVRLAARLLHAVGEHGFDINDYPPEN